MASTTEALLVVAVALLVIYFSRIMFFKQLPKLNLPPGPTALPIIGCLHLLGTRPHRSFTELAKKYGPLMSLTLGQKYCIIASSPEAAKEFLKVQDANFCSRPRLRCAELILRKDVVFDDITPVNRHLRKILVSEITSAKRFETSKYIRTEEIAYMLRSVSKETGPIRVSTYLNIMSSNILSRMVLSKRFLGEGNQNDSEIQEFMEIIEELAFCMGAIHLQDVFDWIPKWFDPQGLDKRFRKLRGRMEVFYKNTINQHKEERRKNPISEGEKTLLDVLLDELHNPEQEVTEEHIEGVIWDALAAGTDTSTVTSEWAMALVIRKPTVMREARSELDRVVGPNRTVQEPDIPELKYIQAIVKETLRLHATAPLLIPHQSINATKAFGYDIPAKTRLFVNIWAIGRDPAIWEKPLEFMPERFLDGAPHATTEMQGQHFELIPFGSGRRSCPGMALGVVAVHLEVANLLHAFEWSLPDGMTPEMLDMTEGQGVTPPMQSPLFAVAKPRLPSHFYEC